MNKIILHLAFSFHIGYGYMNAENSVLFSINIEVHG